MTAPDTKTESDERLLIFTDGSCWPNPNGNGGWAYVIQDQSGKEITRSSGGSRNTTNCRMELEGVIAALSCITTYSEKDLTKYPLIVYSDSQYVIKTMTDGWKRRVNHDLWDKLDKLRSQLQIDWQWIRGHDGHPENELCDELAESARLAL